MRGANNLQRQLAVLAQHHRVALSTPHRVPLAAPPEHASLILEGVASSSKIDVDRVSFKPFCLGTTLPTVPLLIEHDSARRVGEVTPTYDAAGNVLVRTSPLSGDARRYSAFSIAVRNIEFTLRDAGTRHFFAEITSAELTECSLTEFPHLPTALISKRSRPCAQAELYGHAQAYFEILGRKLALLQKEVTHVTPNR